MYTVLDSVQTDTRTFSQQTIHHVAEHLICNFLPHPVYVFRDRKIEFRPRSKAAIS